MKDRYGPWAFINGGSEGIGAEMGNTLAGAGVNICLTARNSGALERQHKHLEETYAVEVRSRTFDLSQSSAVEAILNFTADLDVGFYAHVASSASLGPYLDIAPERHRQALQVNVNSLHELTYHFALKMRQRGSGGIVLCSSMASLSPSPNNAQYAANKAYIRLLGEALWYEFREYGIDVLSPVISEVSTPALLRSGSDLQGGSKTLTPEQVVTEIFAMLGREPSFVTGRTNRVLAFLLRHFVPKKKGMQVMAEQIQRFKDAPDVHS